MKYILLIEDDIALGTIVKDFLNSEGYSVFHAQTFKNAHDYLGRKTPDLILLDLMLTDGNGFSFSRDYRKNKGSVPIIIITSCKDINDMKTGYELGCEDYLRKPFNFDELLIRIKKAIGDLNTGIGYFRKIGMYRFNPVTQNLYFGDNYETIGNLEASVLAELTAQNGETVEKNNLLDKYWGGYSVYTSRNLDSVIVKLRKRFTKDPNIRIISLKRQGYRIVIV